MSHVPCIHCMGHTYTKEYSFVYPKRKFKKHGFLEFPFAKSDNPECVAYGLLASGDWTMGVGLNA